MKPVPLSESPLAIERLPDSAELLAFHAEVTEMVFHSKLTRTAMQLGAADLQQALYEQISLVEHAARFKELSPHLTPEQTAILEAEVAAFLTHIQTILQAELARTAFQLQQASLPRPTAPSPEHAGFFAGVRKGLTFGQAGKTRQRSLAAGFGWDVLAGVGE